MDFGVLTAMIADFVAANPEADIKHVSYDAVSYSGMLEANQESFGKAALPTYNIAKAKSREIQAETSLYLSRLEVERAVMEHTLAYRLRLQELVQWGSDALEEFQESAELGDRHYRLGALPIGTYMELQREYLDAVEAIVDLQAEAIEARGKLEVLTGLEPELWSRKEKEL